MFDKVLAGMDVGVAGAAWRIVVGFSLVPCLRIAGLEPTLQTVLGALLVLLFLVKVIAAVARRIVPVSSDTEALWQLRRDAARIYDSFQWRKLLWFGSGLMLSATAFGFGSRAQWLAGTACFVAGTVAEVLWRRKKIVSFSSSVA
jgi:hypothetical protein